jgi:hypothetical protein
LVMAFALVYSAEHFVVDILLGWALAAIVPFVMGRLESAWSRRRASRLAVADLAEPAIDLASSLVRQHPIEAVGGTPDMEGDHHSVQRPQRVSSRQRLGTDDVEACSRESVRPQTLDDSSLVDDWAARCVD